MADFSFKGLNSARDVKSSLVAFNDFIFKFADSKSNYWYVKTKSIYSDEKNPRIASDFRSGSFEDFMVWF